jgi:hypothetical protein
MDRGSRRSGSAGAQRAQWRGHAQFPYRQRGHRAGRERIGRGSCPRLSHSHWRSVTMRTAQRFRSGGRRVRNDRDRAVLGLASRQMTVINAQPATKFTVRLHTASGHTHVDSVLPRHMGSGSWKHRDMVGYTSVGVGTAKCRFRRGSFTRSPHRRGQAIAAVCRGAHRRPCGTVASATPATLQGENENGGARVRRQLQTRNLHFAVRPVPKVRYSEAFQEWICLDYFFSLGPTRRVGVRHNDGSVGILHCR